MTALARAWGKGALALAAAMALPAGNAFGDELPPAPTPKIDVSARGKLVVGEAERGRITIGMQSLHTGSLITDIGTIPGRTETDTQSMRISADYVLNPDWELHASLPYIRKRSNGGPGAHNPALLDVPHPEADFLDDGQYHSNWQDWSLGVSHRSRLGGFDFEQSITLNLPSHDYSFFANAATGQQMTWVELGVDFLHQPIASNFYYTFGYSYLIRQEFEGVNSNKNHLRANVGYFFSPRFSLRAFANGSYGKGRDSSDFTERRSEAWYQHDRTSRHNYAIVGLGANYQINDRYWVSASAATMVWGRTVHDLKHAYELQVSRSF